MGQQFENLKTKLRQAGCEVETDNQFKLMPGSLGNLLRVYPRGEYDHPVRCFVIDMGAEGYRLFIENDTLKIDDDVDAIIENKLSQEPA